MTPSSYPLRVLHLPVNTASIASNTVRALRGQGVDAYGLVFETTAVQSFDGLQPIRMGDKRRPHQALIGLLRFGYHLARYLRQGRPDVIHWYYSGSAATLDTDLRLIKTLGVPGLVEWTGTDIRIPEVEFAENPYYTMVFDQGYEYRRFESREQSHQRQARFAAVGFASVAAAGMMQYMQHNLFRQVFQIEQRLLLDEYQPVYPESNNSIPLVVHSPTAPITKGTTAVLKAIEHLRPKLRFEFQLIQGVPRHWALEFVRRADIFLDQFVLGDRGIAALEAMAFGKPVICYLKPSLVEQYPPDLPIVNASQDNLAEVIAALIQDGPRRNDLGRQGRAYVERQHDAAKIVPRLVEVYNQVIAQHRKATDSSS
jgi:hypothetical protein